MGVSPYVTCKDCTILCNGLDHPLILVSPGAGFPDPNLPRVPRREGRDFSRLLLLPLPWMLSQLPAPNSWAASVHSFSARLSWPWCQKSQPPPTHMPFSPPELSGCCILVSRTTWSVCQCYMPAAEINSNCYETIIYLYLKLGPLIPGSPGTYTWS